jgi:hypothetical protein
MSEGTFHVDQCILHSHIHACIHVLGIMSHGQYIHSIVIYFLHTHTCLVSRRELLMAVLNDTWHADGPSMCVAHGADGHCCIGFDPDC